MTPDNSERFLTTPDDFEYERLQPTLDNSERLQATPDDSERLRIMVAGLNFRSWFQNDRSRLRIFANFTHHYNKELYYNEY